MFFHSTQNITHTINKIFKNHKINFTVKWSIMWSFEFKFATDHEIIDIYNYNKYNKYLEIKYILLLFTLSYG